MKLAFLQIFVTILFSIVKKKIVVQGKILESIYWNTTNPQLVFLYNCIIIGDIFMYYFFYDYMNRIYVLSALH